MKNFPPTPQAKFRMREVAAKVVEELVQSGSSSDAAESVRLELAARANERFAKEARQELLRRVCPLNSETSIEDLEKEVLR